MSLISGLPDLRNFLPEPQVKEIVGDSRLGPIFKTKDASVDAATDKVDAGKLFRGLTGTKVTDNQLLDVLKSASDLGKVTRQEWNQVRDWAYQNWSSLEPKAQALFMRMDQAAHAGLIRGSNPNDAVLSGQELSRVLQELTLRVVVDDVVDAGRKRPLFNPGDGLW